MGIFTNKTGFTSFDEIKYFVNAKIGYQAFSDSSIRNVNFSNCIFDNARQCFNSSSVENIDISDCKVIGRFDGAFHNCTEGIKTFKFGEHTFDECTDVTYMFAYSKADQIDISGINIPLVTKMSYMFNLSSVDNIKANDISAPLCTTVAMFASQRNVKTISMKNFNAPSLTSAKQFAWRLPTTLQSVDISGWTAPLDCDYSAMFSEANLLTYLNMNNVEMHSTNCNYMFYGCKLLTSIDLSGLHTENCTSFTSMFDGCSSLTELDVTGFSTSNCTTMANMFKECSSLTSIDVTGFDTINVTTMGSMFNGCNSLTSINVSGFDTSNVTTMANMFNGCSSLATIDVTGFNISACTNMAYMFYGCSALTSIDVSSWNTSNVTNMKNIFDSCKALQEITGVENLVKSSCTDAYGMFWNCNALTSISTVGWDTSNVTSFRYCFRMMTSCTTADFSGIDTSSATDVVSMFDQMNSCSSLKFSSKFFNCVTRTNNPIDINCVIGVVSGGIVGKWTNLQEITDFFNTMPDLTNGGYTKTSSTLKIWRTTYDIANANGLITQAAAKGWTITRA